MDQRLVDQSITFHGPALLDALEQEDVNVSLPNFLTYSHRVPPNADRPRDERYNKTIAQFVAQKADLLFSRSARPNNSFYDPHLQESDLYAVLPPLEAFMDVPFGEKRHHFFRSIDRGHIVFGQVLALQESGLIVAILAVEYGPIRELDQLKVVAFCPVRETPLLSHQDIADSYQIKDFVRGVVTDVAVDDERILISLLPRSLPREMTHVKMGMVTDDEIPLHFRRLRNIGSRGYGDHLKRILGFANPSAIETLSTCLGIPCDGPAPSLMRGLRCVSYPKNQYAEALRKEQSYRWAIKSVAEGVAKFKEGNHLEAMQLLNKALQIDEENVEAMVARGAIYANNESYDKAIDDFEVALKLNADHRNARKYLCEVMLARGAECMDDPKRIDTAVHCFQRILDIDPSREDARGMLRRVHDLSQKSEVINIDMEEKSPLRRRLSSGANQDSGSIRKSTDTLRRIIAEEEKSKKSKKSHRRHSSRSPDKRRSRSRSPRRSKNHKSYSRSPKSSYRSKSSSRRSRSSSPKAPGKSTTPDKSKTSVGVEGAEGCPNSLKGVPEQYLKIAEDAGLSRAELEDFLKKIDVPTGPGGSTILGLEGAEETAVEDKSVKETDDRKGTPQPTSHQGEKRYSEASSLPKMKEEKKADVEMKKNIPDFTLPSKEDLMKPEVLAQLMKNLPEEGYNQLAKVFESMKKEEKETTKGTKKASSLARKRSRSPDKGSSKKGKGEIRKGKVTTKGKEMSRSRGRSPAGNKSSDKKKTTKGRKRYSSSSSSSSSSGSSSSSSSSSSGSSSSDSSPRRWKGTLKKSKVASKKPSRSVKSPEVNTDVRKITVSAKKADPKSAEKLRNSDHLTITTDSSGSRNISAAEKGVVKQAGFGRITPLGLVGQPAVKAVPAPPPPPQASETRVVTASKDTGDSAQHDSSSNKSARGRGFLPGFIPRGVRNPSRRGGRGFDIRGRGARGRGFEVGSGSYGQNDSRGRGFDIRGRGAHGRGFEGGSGSHGQNDSLGSGRGVDSRGRSGYAGRVLPIRGRGRANAPSFKRERSRDRSRSRDRRRRHSRSHYDRSSSGSTRSRSRSRSRGRYHSRSRSLSRSRDKKSFRRASRFDKSRSRSPPKKGSNGSAPKGTKGKDDIKPEKTKESLDEMIVFFNDLKNRKTPKK